MRPFNRKPAFIIGEKQKRRSATLPRRMYSALDFPCAACSIFLVSISKISRRWSLSVAEEFMSDLVGKPEDRFSRNEA